MRVADYIIQRLEEEGVEYVFMLSGGGMMHLQDALSRSKKIKYVCFHHEQSATYAAEAFSRFTGKIGVVFSTSGPGAANTITGILQAYIDSSSLLVITGQAKLSETVYSMLRSGLRQFGTFECNIVPIVDSITKYSVFCPSSETIELALSSCFMLAKVNRPGPCLIDIPVDIQGKKYEQS